MQVTKTMDRGGHDIIPPEDRDYPKSRASYV